MPKLWGSEDATEGGRALTSNRGIFAVWIVWCAFCGVLAFGIGFWNEGMSNLFIFITFCIWFGPSFWSKLRHETKTSVSTPDGHFSLNPQEIYTAGPWIIFHVGGIISGGFSWRGGQGTIIVPNIPLIVNYQKARRSFYVNAHPHIVRYEHLLPEIRHKIRDHKIGPPYRFAIAPAEYPLEFEGEMILVEKTVKGEDGETREIKIPMSEAVKYLVGLESHMERVAQQNTRLEGFLDGDIDRVLDVASVGEQLAKRRRPGIKERISKRTGWKEEEGGE